VRATALPGKIARGTPYLVRELRSVVSDHTPWFIAVPRVVHIWRGAPCNAKCPMCPWGFLEGDALAGIVRSPFTDDHMPKALEQIAELSGPHTIVSYMGGEPMVKRGLIDWVEQARALGLDFRFTTNGYLMTEELAQRFVAAGLFNLGVSLESLDPEINEAMRPFPDGTEKTIRCIDLILAERRRQRARISVNIKTVLTDLNLESFVEIVERYGRTDGVLVTPQPFEAIDGMPEGTRQQLFVKDVDRLRRTMDRIRDLKRCGYNVHVTEQHLHEFVKQYEDDPEHVSTMHTKDLRMDDNSPDCNIATDNLWILDGDVKLCPHHPPIGNFVTGPQTLKELWEAELTRDIRERTRACRRLCTISCLRRTPLRHKISTYLKIG
jgi:MoaA/NifB/PqqE/SkfB family radical SAM enzyme